MAAVVEGVGVETCCYGARYSVAADLASGGMFDRISGVLFLLRSGDAGAGLIVERSLVVAVHGSVASVEASACYYVQKSP